MRLPGFLLSPRGILGLRIAAAILVAGGVTLLYTAPEPMVADLDSARAITIDLPPPTTEDEPEETELPPPAPIAALRSSKPIAIRTADGSGILHYYEESRALLAGPAEVEAELDEVAERLHERGFGIERLIDPNAAQLTDAINSLATSQAHGGRARRSLIYLSGPTIDAGGRNEIFFRTIDTPEGEPSLGQLRTSAYPFDALRYLPRTLEGGSLLVVVNSGFRSSFLEESGELPTLLDADAFQHPAPFFLVADAKGGHPHPEFARRFLESFEGGADSDGDRQVSTIELARFLGKPAYLAAMREETRRSGPGMVFNLPPSAVVEVAHVPAESDPLLAVAPPPSASDQASPPKSALEAAMPSGKSESTSRDVRPPPPAQPLPPALAEDGAPSAGSSFLHPNSLAMRWIAPGEFRLKLPTPTPASEDLPIAISGFWLSQSEVTSGQYSRVTGAPRSGDSDEPATNLSWNEAVAFCETLTRSEQEAGRLPEGFHYRLPYEVEWEFAASEGPIRFRRINLDPPATLATKFVSRAPQSLSDSPAVGPSGLMAMTAGSLEWCLDDYLPSSPETGAPSPPDGAKVVRGGVIGAEMERAAIRFGIYSALDRLPFVGFRVALAPETIEQIGPSPPPPLIEEGTILTRDQLFENSPYSEWDNYNKSQVLRKAQKIFKDLAIYESSVDGASGPSTQKAVNQYQADHRLPVSGQLDSATLQSLGLDQETKQKAPPSGPWWVTRPSSPRQGDPEPPGSAYHGPVGRIKLLNDKKKGTLNQAEYRKFQTYARWEEVQ